jgi:hypothetical protein
MWMMQRMNSIPATREEFERNLFLMAEQMRSGKVFFHPRVHHSIRGIQWVRKLPNSRIDFLSVDEAARLHANTIANMRMMRLELGPEESTSNKPVDMP